MEVLSPRSANVPMKSREMKKSKSEQKAKPADNKPTNPDRIDDKWRPPSMVTEPGAQESYITGRKLGKGGFAVCFEGQSQKTGKIYALKVVKAKVEQKKMMEKFRTELQIHAKMQHPYVVDFLRAFTVNNHTYVVLELCSNGNLTDMVKARSCLSLPEVRRFMIQICGGVRYMHKRNVIHRDLKMGNIFLDAKMDIKIGDFGLAAVMADEQDRRTTLCGTPNYIAPEILSKSGVRGHDNKVDTWAIGVITYAMLMGTPPFQSKTQQEIYAKLKTLEYEWKIDSKNYIPQQAKDFVASCLNLVAAERPEMDDLVEHEFFKMGAVAEALGTGCLTRRPAWLKDADPRGDKVDSNYGMTQAQLCRIAGVGRLADGKPRPGVGGKCSISTLVEIEAENQQGTAPTIPLPEGILYNAFSEVQADWTCHQKHPIQPAKPRSRKPVGEPHNSVGLEALPEDTQRAGQAMPIASRNMPSFAAQQRQQAVPRNTSRQVRPPMSTLDSAPSSDDAPNVAPSEGLLRARPLRTASTRVTRSTSQQPLKVESTKTLQKSATLPSALDMVAEAAAEIAPVSTLPVVRSLRAMAPSHTRAALKLASIEENATIRPKSSQSINIDNLEAQILQPTSANDRRPRTASVSDPIRGLEAKRNTEFGLPSTLVSPKQKPRLISSSDSYTSLPDTSALSTLSQLQTLHTMLGSRSIDHPPSSARTNRRLRARLPYPRVDKWVDYSSKHGIAYILTDGTLGMVIKSSEDSTRPSACVAVRNAKAHTILRAKGLACQLVPQGRRAQDVEFYEQSDITQDMKRFNAPASTFALENEKYSSLTEASNALQSSMEGAAAERFKELVLLDKFGKYMNKRYEEADVDTDPETQAGVSQHFIHFYQRLGNVGVWRFADGGLQFNFPDHTKLTIYQDKTSRNAEYVVDLVFLEPSDAVGLNRRGRLTVEALERRGSMTLALVDCLAEQSAAALTGDEADVVRTNQVKEKLQWVRAVLGCWIKERGVGRMGEERLGWSGLQEKRDPGKVKLTWVTVGRAGGDGDGL